jgi:hypothetical protein
VVGPAGEEVDGQRLGGPLPETFEPVRGDTPLRPVGNGAQPGRARSAEGVDTFGHHLHAADVDAVDDAHAGGAELGV